MRERASVGAVTIVGTTAVAIAQLGRLKLFAVLLGTAGTGLIAQVVSLQAVLLSLAPLHSGVPLLAALASASEREPWAPLATARGVALVTAGSLGLASALALVWVGGDHSSLVSLLLVGCIGVPFAALATVEQTALQSRGRFVRLAYANVVSALLGLLAIGLLTWRAGPFGAAAGLSVALAISWIVPFALVDGGRAIRLERRAALSMLHLGAGALLAAILVSLGQALIRLAALGTLGASGAGIVHVLIGLPLAITYLGASALGSYAQPRIAAAVARGDTEAIKREVTEIRRIGGALVGTAMVATALAAEPLVLIVLSHEFRDVARLLPIQLLGELLRLRFWLTGSYLLPMGFRRLFVGVEVLVYGTLLPIAVVLAPSAGVAAFALAHVIAMFTVLVFLSAHARKAVGVRPMAGATLIVIQAGALVAVAAGHVGVGATLGVLSAALGLRTLLARPRTAV